MHRCNWKIFLENLNDLMHPMVTHMSSSGTARSVANRHFGKGEKLPAAIEILGPFTSNYEFFEDMGIHAFPGGHSYSGGTVSIHSRYSEIDAYNDAMNAAYGEARAREIFSMNRHNTIVYPSLTLKGPIQTIRVIKPISVDRTLVESWTFRMKGAPDELLERSILYCNLINSSANLVGPDDHEAYQRIQTGLMSEKVEWVNMQRHMGKEQPNADGGWSAMGTSDLVFRNQYRTWAAYMETAA
jgi:phenylpropionate dioxygenase-like ring-hydroxylating dioxygenase large terminal subunit